MSENSAYDIVPWEPADLLVTVCREELLSIRFLKAGEDPPLELPRDPEQAAFATTQLKEYLKGTRRNFDLPLTLRGSPFQINVWGTLCDIDYGATLTYSDVARKMGRYGASRAIGGAVSRNHIPIVVPCHRVLANDGIGGFTGGLEIKRALLTIEGVTLD